MAKSDHLTPGFLPSFPNPLEVEDEELPIIVEIDESLFFHCKYHRGTVCPNHWVLGGIERGSRKCFLVEFKDRKRATLEGLVWKYIMPGSYIMSDMRAAYSHIENISNGIQCIPQ